MYLFAFSCVFFFQVKVLGCLALIDGGETDWKIFTIDVKDPLAEKLNDIDDVEKLMPGLLRVGHCTYRTVADKNLETFSKVFLIAVF